MDFDVPPAFIASILASDFAAIQLRAEDYRTGVGGPKSLVKYRILQFISTDYAPYTQQLLPSENRGLFNVICNGCNKGVDAHSISELTEALKYLEKLPQQVAKVGLLQQKIFAALRERIIPAFPIHDDFNQKVQCLEPARLNNLIYLIKTFAKKNYAKEGITDVFKTLSYEAFARSQDPNALSTLKTLGKICDASNFWIGMYHLKQNLPGGFFTSSSKQKALHYFQIAAANSNSDVKTRYMAIAQLEKMKSKSKTLPITPQTRLTPSTLTQNPSQKKTIDHQQYLSQEQNLKSATRPNEPLSALPGYPTPSAINQTLPDFPPIPQHAPYQQAPKSQLRNDKESVLAAYSI